MKVILALPIYNEQDGIPLLLESFIQVMGTDNVLVVAVNDGSDDNTDKVLCDWYRKVPMSMVIHFENMGLGATIEDALRCAAAVASSSDDVIVTMDADNTHSPMLIPEMVRRIESGDDIVIASRYCADSLVVGLSAFRTAMSIGAAAVLGWLCPIPGVRDYTCGFRAYRAGLLQQVFKGAYGDSLITESGFTCMAEILLKLSRLDPQISEVPMTLRYDRKHSKSKMRPWVTAFRTLRLAVRFAWRRSK